MPGSTIPTCRCRASSRADRPRALVVFYRALVQSGDLAPIDALVRALAANGLDAVGLYVTSLKDAEAAAVTRSVLAVQRPAVILNATAFAAGADDPLAAADAAVLQVILAGSAEQAWRDGTPRPGAARSRDARGAARAGRADRRLRRVVQGRGPARPAHRDRPRPPPAGGRPRRARGPAGRRLGAPARHPGSRSAGSAS